MSFTIFYNGKAPVWAKKTISPKRRKIKFFSKGINPWFWSKNGHFSKGYKARSTSYTERPAQQSVCNAVTSHFQTPKSAQSVLLL